MAAIIVMASCLCGGSAVGLWARWCLDGRGRPRRRKSSRNGRERAVELLELLGHWVPIIRLSNLGPVRSWALRMQPVMVAHGWGLTWRGCVACALVCVVGGAFLGGVVSLSVLGALVVALAVCAGGAVAVGGHERRAKIAASEQMPEVLRSLASALGAGRSLPQAMEHAGRTLDDPLGPELLKVSFEIKGGRSIERAVDGLCERVGVPGMALLGTALQVSQRTGSSLNELFARTARMVTDDVGLRRELEVKTSQVRLSARVVAGMPVVLAGVLVVLSPDYRMGLSLAGGRICLCVAALLDIGALWLVRHLMKGAMA